MMMAPEKCFQNGFKTGNTSKHLWTSYEIKASYLLLSNHKFNFRMLQNITDIIPTQNSLFWLAHEQGNFF